MKQLLDAEQEVFRRNVHPLTVLLELERVGLMDPVGGFQHQTRNGAHCGVHAWLVMLKPTEIRHWRILVRYQKDSPFQCPQTYGSTPDSVRRVGHAGRVQWHCQRAHSGPDGGRVIRCQSYG